MWETESQGKGGVTKQDLVNSRPPPPSCTTTLGVVTRPHKRRTGALGPPARPTPPTSPALRNYYILIAVLTGSVRSGSSSSCCGRPELWRLGGRSPIGRKVNRNLAQTVAGGSKHNLLLLLVLLLIESSRAGNESARPRFMPDASRSVRYRKLS